MSVLIKGMEMPTSCHACCFFGQADIWESDFDGYTKSYCKRTGSQTFDYVDKILPNCPLIHVPPHGRLVEDIAVIEQIDEWLNSVGTVMVGHGLSYYGELLGCIEDAPTIIPAEEGE